MLKRSPGSLIWIFGFGVERANILFIEPTVIWEMLLLCELLLLVGFLMMNISFCYVLSPLIFFVSVASPLAINVNSSLHHRTKGFQQKFHKF